MKRIKDITIKRQTIRTVTHNGIDYICITDIAKQKNSIEPKDVIKNWMRSKNTLEYLGLWERLNNPLFKGVEFDPLMSEAGSNAFTMSPSRWVETTDAIRNNLVPAELTALQISIIYANEADVLNVSLFGTTAKQ